MDLADKKEELGPIEELVRDAEQLIRVARSDACPSFAFDNATQQAVTRLEAAAKALRTLRDLR